MSNGSVFLCILYFSKLFYERCDKSATFIWLFELTSVWARKREFQGNIGSQAKQKEY